MKSGPKKKSRTPAAPRNANTPDDLASGVRDQTLEQKIGYAFKDATLLRQALTHPSCQPDAPGSEQQNNQRLEFLGDAVLDLILSERIFALYPEAREGDLSRYRASLAKGVFLSQLARDLGLGEHLYLSRGEIESGGRDRKNLLEDALESLVGAIYLDGGLPATRRIVLKWYGDIRKKLEDVRETENPKGRLQEEIQAGGDEIGPEYRVVTEEGPSHDRRFVVEVLLRDTRLGTGNGASKKEAEARAAENALRTWRKAQPGSP